MSFYVTLPSNTKSYSSTNTTSCFTTLLPTPLELSGEYMVGLAEIQFPFSFQNIDNDQNKARILIKLVNGKFLKILIPPGYYKTVEELLKMIQKAVKSLTTTKFPKLKLEFHVKNKKVWVEMSPNIENIRMSPLLQYMLGWGLDEGVISITGQNRESMYSPDMSASMTAIYVYSDCVSPNQIVGDTHAPLLRVCPVNMKKLDFGQTVTQIYNTCHYVPVVKNNISSIEITLCDDRGNKIPFMYGKCIVKLHFIKKPNRLL